MIKICRSNSPMLQRFTLLHDEQRLVYMLHFCIFSLQYPSSLISVHSEFRSIGNNLQPAKRKNKDDSGPSISLTYDSRETAPITSSKFDTSPSPSPACLSLLASLFCLLDTPLRIFFPVSDCSVVDDGVGETAADPKADVDADDGLRGGSLGDREKLDAYLSRNCA